MDGVSGTEGIFTECKKGAFASPLISKDIMRRPAPPFDAIDRDSRWPGPSCYVFLVFYPILLLTLHINYCQLLFTMCHFYFTDPSSPLKLCRRRSLITLTIPLSSAIV